MDEKAKMLILRFFSFFFFNSGVFRYSIDVIAVLYFCQYHRGQKLSLSFIGRLNSYTDTCR